MANVNKFILTLMNSRKHAHMLHLMTSSFAEHKALQGYYEAIIPLVDSYAETYMGQDKKLKYVDVSDKHPKNALSYFSDLDKEIRSLNLPQESPLRNIQDEIMGLVLSTLYMLRNLK
jgi:hypothetical protein